MAMIICHTIISRETGQLLLTIPIYIYKAFKTKIDNIFRIHFFHIVKDIIINVRY